MNNINEIPPYKLDIPDEIIIKWQRVVDLMAKTVGVPTGLIMRVDPPQIEVFLSSSTEGNPYTKGEREDLQAGLYCETVMNQRSPLLVPDALKDPNWDKNPDIELGMVYYLGFPLQWPNGETFGTICVLDNKHNPDATNYKELISEFQKIVESDLQFITETAKHKKAEALLLQLGDNLPEGAVYRLVHDVSGRRYFDYTSSGFERMFGFKTAELMKDAIPLYDLAHPDDMERVIATETRSIETLSPFNFEGRAIFPNGEIRWYKWHSQPVRLDNGTINFDGVCLDITERKEIEEALKKAHDDLESRVEERTAQLSKTVDKLKETELRYRTVADFTYDWEFWASMDGTLRYVSPSCGRISGYTSGQFIDNPALLREIIITEDQDVWDKHYHDSRKEPKASEIQFRIRAKDGAVRWIEHACQPVTGDQGELLGFRASNRDITNRKEGEIKLQNAYSEIKALKAQLEADRTYLREEIKLAHDHENIIGDSDILKYVLFRAEQIAPTDTTVLILGETGTGKELIARAIHNASPRKERPLIKVDCASLPANLIESELFGHEKGAFTNAVEKRMGRFELAHGATLFLDEIGELPLELQPKLLRVLQDGEFERLGSSQTIHTDVRVIAATNRDLEEDVRKKQFRMDLWYRLNVFAISLPPLRERAEDIALLVNYMIKNFERKHGKRITSIPTNVLTKLQGYSWPGNIREMENVIECAVINTQGDTLQLTDSLTAHLPSGLESSDLPMKTLAELEREHILRMLKNTNWRIHGKNGTADLLDINPSTLRGRMRKHGIQRPPYKT